MCLCTWLSQCLSFGPHPWPWHQLTGFLFDRSEWIALLALFVLFAQVFVLLLLNVRTKPARPVASALQSLHGGARLRSGRGSCLHWVRANIYTWIVSWKSIVAWKSRLCEDLRLLFIQGHTLKAFTTIIIMFVLSQTLLEVRHTIDFWRGKKSRFSRTQTSQRAKLVTHHCLVSVPLVTSQRAKPINGLFIYFI